MASRNVKIKKSRERQIHFGKIANIEIIDARMDNIYTDTDI
jgi:hypothetical protein